MVNRMFQKIPVCDSPIILAGGIIAGLVIAIDAVVSGDTLWVFRLVFGVVLMIHVIHMMWFYKKYGGLNELVAHKIKNS